MVSHMTHMSLVEPISFNADYIGYLVYEQKKQIAFIDQRAAPLVKYNSCLWCALVHTTHFVGFCN